MNQPFERQDIGYLLTAYADGQLAPEGVMWVEEQLDANADLRARLKEIRQLQAGLRAAFAGGAPDFVLDLPRRNALLASAANPPRKKIRFQPLLWSGLAASVMAVVFVGMQMTQPLGQSMARGQVEAELPPPMRLSLAEPAVESATTVDGRALARADDLADEKGGNYFFGGRGDQGGQALKDQRATATATYGVPQEQAVEGVSVDKNALVAGVPANRPMAEREALGQTKADGLARRKAEALKEVDAFAAAPAATTPSPTPASPPPSPVVVAKAAPKPAQETASKKQAEAQSKSLQRGANPGEAGAAAPARDEYVRLNETGAYNGALTGAKGKSEEKSAGPSAANAAPAKPSAPGAQPKVEEPPVVVAEVREERRTLLSPESVVELDAVADRQAADEELAKGREAAVATTETGSTGAFQAIGAGGGSAGAFTSRSGGGRVAANKLSENKKQMEDLQAAWLEARTDGRTADAERLAKEVARVSQENDALRTRYPKIYAEIGDEKTTASFFQGVVASMRNNPQGEQDVLMLTIGKGAKVAPGHELIVIRDNKYVVRVQVEQTVGDAVICRVLRDSWNTDGRQVQQGDLAIPFGGGDLTRAIVAPRSLLESQTIDPQRSLAALRAPVTVDGALPLAHSLRVIAGEQVGFTLGNGIDVALGRQVQVSLRDEPAARGILRAVRSAGLQAQFTGGVVKLDNATTPLDPSDAQGYDLPTFKDLLGTQPMQSIAVDPIQTVAIDADTASYEYAKARIASGQPIDPATIKPEHFINAMPMDYPAAQGPEAFSLYAEAAASPFARANTAWGARTAVVSIGAVAKPAAADERKPLALTLAIDCSGSMAQPGGLDRIRQGLFAFVEHLRAEDRVAIVAFGDQARVILPATPGNDRTALTNALSNLSTGGATNAAEGLGLAYQLAAETAAPERESRVLLATDGGTVAGADDLLRRVTAFKDRGITLVVVGTGATYRAGPLQELASKGDGQHFYVGSDADAQALFTGKLLPDRLAVLAKDAKLQVTWNPQRISHARLIGYDQRRLAAKDFRNNAVDAGELSQDTQVTALFEVLLVDGGTGPLGTAAVRYHDMRRGEVRELACPLPGSILQSQPSDRLRLLSCSAATAEWLQRGWWSNVHLITPQEIAAQLARCPQPIAQDLRALLK